MEIACTLKGQQPGSVILTETSIIYETNQGISLLKYEWQELDKDHYAPAHDARAMAKLVFKDDVNKNYVFNFNSKDDLNTFKKYTGQCKHLVQQTLQVAKPHVDTLQAIHTTLLARDEKLRKLYEDLVIGGILNQEEFWTSVDLKHQHIIDQEEIEGLNVKGSASTLYSDLADVLSPMDNPEIKAHVFKMYPYVKIAFEETVPQKMGEKEFWDIYMKSDSFRKDKGRGIASQSTGDMFQKYESRYEQTQKKQRVDDEGSHTRVIGVDPGLDLSLTCNEYGYVEARDLEDRDSRGAAAAVVNKYNRNSKLVLTQGQSQSDVRSSKPREQADLDEMQPTQAPRKEFMPISERHLGSRSHSVPASASLFADAVGMNTDVRSILPSDARASAFLAETQQLCSGMDTASEVSSISNENLELIKEEFLSVSQLLRHFYVSLSQQNDPTGGKMSKLVEKLNKKQDELIHRRLKLQETTPRSEGAQLKLTNKAISAICDMIERANVVWEKYQSTMSFLADDKTSRWSVVT